MAFAAALTLLSIAAAGCNGQPGALPNAGYDFPVRPGMPEWQTMGSHSQMLAACQLPEDALQGMTTRALVHTVLDYPLLGDMLAHNFPQDGVDAVRKGFNGLSELMARPDAGPELLAIFHSPELADFPKADAYRAILAQYSVLETLNRQELKGLLAEVLQDIEAAHATAGRYDFHQEYSLWVLGRALEVAGCDTFALKAEGDIGLRNFLRHGAFAEETTRDFIIAAARDYPGQAE